MAAAVQLIEAPTDGEPDDQFLWEVVDRNDRHVLVSDLGDTEARRVARVEIGSTRITIRAFMSGQQLVELAANLVPLT